jgi:dTDP-4-amino-4,6-dideoxygalactose transaminase
MSKFLPFAVPDIGEAEIEEVCRTLRSGWLTTGPKVKRFESEFASFIGARHALAVNSATAGLHLSLEAIGIEPGDKVLTSIYTFTSTAEVIRYFGAHPVFVDIDETTLNLDVEKVREAVETCPDLKAIIPVHIAGQSCDMDSVLRVADQGNCRVIEDAAHALPTTYNGRLIGTIGDVTVFSFYATKTLSTGEGGMVVTNNDQIASRIRTMRMHGIDRDVYSRYQTEKPFWYYEVVAPGFKYNMPDIAASIGVHQLARLEEMLDRRQTIAERYLESFSDLPVRLPVPVNAEDLHAWHLFIMQLELDRLAIDRNRFIELMSEQGVGTSVHFIPLHLQPYWRDTYGLQSRDFPVASSVFERVVSLPIYSKMSDEDVDQVISAVRKLLLDNRQKKYPVIRLKRSG